MPRGSSSRGASTKAGIASCCRRPTRRKGSAIAADYRGAPLVSLEDRAARALGLKIGDAITVSILGVDVPARIAALRRIDRGGLGLNFAIVFSPGYIEEAPHSLLASAYSVPDRDGAVARDVARALPSITPIRTGDVIGQIGAVLRQVDLAIRAAAGTAVLVGAVAASARARRNDTAILKLLGGTTRQVLAAQAIEYAILSLILVGVALAIGTSAGWFVVTRTFALSWDPAWSIVAATTAVAVTATMSVGLLGSLSALRARPATALRKM